MITGHKYHDDIQGIAGTVTGGTAYRLLQLRNTGIFIPHINQTEILTMIFQFSHRKSLNTAVDGIHLHYIPIASANGNIKFDFTYGWFNHDTVLPNTLPNVGSSIDIPLLTTDQYQMKITEITGSIQPPANEEYSSMLFVKFTRVAPTGTNWGASNDIAIAYCDAHYRVDRYGSYNEYTD